MGESLSYIGRVHGIGEKKMENNKVKITGKIMETPEYVLTASDVEEKFIEQKWKLCEPVEV